jgi:hypothetical protein
MRLMLWRNNVATGPRLTVARQRLSVTIDASVAPTRCRPLWTASVAWWRSVAVLLTIGDQWFVFKVGHVAVIHYGWHRSDGRWARLSLVKNAQ